MGDLVKAVINQALDLSSLERALVAEQLLLSLDQPDTEIDGLWAKEAEARIDALERGELHKVSTDAVFGKYKSLRSY